MTTFHEFTRKKTLAREKYGSRQPLVCYISAEDLESISKTASGRFSIPHELDENVVFRIRQRPGLRFAQLEEGPQVTL